MNLDRWLYYTIRGTHPPMRRRTVRAAHLRDWRYRAFIRQHLCAVCGTSRGVECAHTGGHGLGMKSSDRECIALCFWCHWAGNHSIHKIGPRNFERLHHVKIGALVKEYQAEWKEIQERRREL